jgi:hypothetical protein
VRGAGTGTVGSSITRTLPTVTRTGPAAPTTEAETTQPATTEEAAPPPSTVIVTTSEPATLPQTHTQTETHTQTRTETETIAVEPATTLSATTTVVNTGAAVVAGAAGAAAVASQGEETESTPWGWIAFGILAAGVVIFAIVWLVRRKHDDGSPSAPATGA